MSKNDWTTAERALVVWLRRARHAQHSHHEAGKFNVRLHYIVSTPVVVITTAIGTTAFATLSESVGETERLVFGGFSMLAAALSAVHTHFRFAEKGEKHKSLGARYGIIRRKIETMLSLPSSERGEPKVVLEALAAEFDHLAEEGPVVSKWIWRKAVKELSSKDADPNRARIGY